jgi:thiosulfate dehydrogenase [quinone] large subunit
MQIARDAAAEEKITSATTQQTASSSTPGQPAAARPLAVVRIVLGTVFLWAFLDKTFGFGFATAPGKAWIAGGSPTAGYLGSIKGSFSGIFQALAGAPLVDWAFMLGLLGAGTALVLGIALRTAAAGGIVLLGLMWLSSLPLKSNPIIDEHVVYATVIIALAAARAGDTWGLGRQWSALTKNPSLRWLR